MVRLTLIVCTFCALIAFRGTIMASLLNAASEFITGPLGITENADANLTLALVQFGLDTISAFIAIVGLWGAYIQLRLITAENSRRRREEILFDDFPDPNFRAYLRSKHQELFEDDPRIPPLGFTAEELNQITRINVTHLSIASLEGIGVFTKLQELLCEGTAIESLNVRGLKELTKISAPNCRSLSEVNCSECESLTRLDLSDSPVRFLDCSGTSVDPKHIECLGTIETLIFRGVFCNDDGSPEMGMLPISVLELTKLNNLRSLDCSGNAIFRLSLPDSIEELNASSNPLIDLRANDSLTGHHPKPPHPLEELEIIPESTTPVNLPYNSLKSCLEQAVELRREDKEQEASDLLIYLWAIVWSSRALDINVVTQNDVEKFALLLHIAVQFGATLTQRSLRLHDWRWHAVDISLAKDVRKRADLIMAQDRSSCLDLSRIIEQRMLATNSLGLAYQRSFPNLHDAEKGVQMSLEAYNYFIEEGQKAIRRYEIDRDKNDALRVFNAIRYCSNYPTALDNYGKDIIEAADNRQILEGLLGPINPNRPSGSYRLKRPLTLALRLIRRQEYLDARKALNKALRVREEIEKKLIIPMFTRECTRYYRAEWLQAGTLRSLAKTGVSGATHESERRYKETINGLRNLEEKAGREKDNKELRQIKTARLGAQHGLSRLYIDVGKYSEASKLAQETYDERAEFLGAEHVDTLKTLVVLEQAENKERRSRLGTSLLIRFRNTLYRTK